MWRIKDNNTHTQGGVLEKHIMYPQNWDKGGEEVVPSGILKIPNNININYKKVDKQRGEGSDNVDNVCWNINIFAGP